jgi:RNA polymerase sigma-70 factor, ECF subfamily
LSGKLSDEGRSFLEAALPHLDVVYRVARNMSRDHHGAEDLVQETFLRAYAAFESHHGPSTRAWLVTICLNLARSEGRRRARRPVETLLTERDVDQAGARGARGPVRAGVPEEAMANIDRASVRRALSRLPEDQRLAIVLMDLAGLTASEVAGMLSCPRNTILSRVHRGHQRLASLLIEEDVNR